MNKEEKQVNILVTGGDGQLGSELKRLMPIQGYQFYFTDVNELNILDFKAVESFIREQKISYLINCAAYTAVDRAETETEIALSLNSEAPGFLGDLTREMGIRLIHLSTDYVFSGYLPRPLTELDEPLPETVYGITKLEGERRLAGHPGAIIIRTSWLYSSFGNNFVKTMLRLMREKDEIRVVYDQVGTPTYAADLAGAIIKLVKGTVEGTLPFEPGIYHYASDGVCSWFDFAKEIARLTGSKTAIIPVETRQYPAPAPRPWYSVLSKDKIRKVYGLDIPYWKDSLATCIKELQTV